MSVRHHGFSQPFATGQRRVSRRAVLVGSARLAGGGALALTLAGRGLRTSLAQDATPAAGLPYPELRVTVVDDPQTGQALQVASSQVPAGYVLLTAVNQSKNESPVGLIGPGPGQTMQQLLQEAERELATPSATASFPPPFFYTATLPGAVDTSAGETAQAVVHLAAGDWAVWGGSESSNPSPVFVTATAGTPTTQTAPTPAVTITEIDFAFGGYGVPISAGQQIWEVRNQGTQPHMLVLGQVPAGTTVAQVLEAVSRPENATPPPGGLTEADFHARGGVALQSPGTTVWPLLDLPAGHYAAMCFVGDPRHGGEPHAMEGMATVFDVG